MGKNAVAVIIAAGRSKRLGYPKSLVKIANHTLASYAVSELKKANIDQIVVVSNAEDSYHLLTEIQDSTLVVNKNPDSGRTSSIKLGIETVMRDKGRIPDKLVLVPVDRPGWNFEHISVLLNQNVSSCISCLGRNGHPVLIVKDNLLDILVSKNDKPLNEIVQFIPVDVDGAIIDLNIDTAEDVEKLNIHHDFFK